MCMTTIASGMPWRAAAAVMSAVGISVSGSTSTSTGSRPAWTIAWTAPQKVMVDVSTRLPGGSPSARNDSSIAVVQEATATACGAPT
jgi:hypothetical protein